MSLNVGRLAPVGLCGPQRDPLACVLQVLWDSPSSSPSKRGYDFVVFLSLPPFILSSLYVENVCKEWWDKERIFMYSFSVVPPLYCLGVEDKLVPCIYTLLLLFLGCRELRIKGLKLPLKAATSNWDQVNNGCFSLCSFPHFQWFRGCTSKIIDSSARSLSR